MRNIRRITDVIVLNENGRKENNSLLELFRPEDLHNVIAVNSYLANNFCDAYLINHSKNDADGPGRVRIVASADKNRINDLLDYFSKYTDNGNSSGLMWESSGSIFSVKKYFFDNSRPGLKFNPLHTDKYIHGTNQTMAGRQGQSSVYVDLMTPVRFRDQYDYVKKK